MALILSKSWGVNTLYNSIHSKNKVSSPQNPQNKHKKHLFGFSIRYTSNPEITVIYKGNKMIIFCDSRIEYLVVPKIRSRIGSYYYLRNKAGK